MIKAALDQAGIDFPEYEDLMERIEQRNLDTSKLDPEAKETPEKIVTDLGLEFVEHQFHTKDKYIITTWQIWNKTNHNKLPIILNHGVLDDGFTWFVQDYKHSLVKPLIDSGYEIWIISNRGTRYSHTHEIYTHHQKKFWEFAWDSMAEYDLPDHVEYIKNVTGVEKMGGFVGHSQGCSMFFAKVILDASFADNFNSFVGLAPVSTIDSTPSHLIQIAIDLHLADLLNMIGIHHLLELSDKEVSPLFADLIALIPDTLMDIIKMIAGHGKNSVYLKTRIPVMAAHEPGGTSMPNL